MRLPTLSAASGLLSATLLGLGSVRAEDAVPEIAPPKTWDHFVILMWQFQTDVRKDQAVYESLNLNGFHVDRRNDELVALGKAKLTTIPASQCASTTRRT